MRNRAHICSALSRNLRNPRIAQRKPGIPGLPGKPGIARSDSRNAHSDLCSNQERSWGDQRARDSLKIFTSVGYKRSMEYTVDSDGKLTETFREVL